MSQQEDASNDQVQLFDMAKFIRAVRNQPALWDKRTPDYTVKGVRDESWDNIGREMFADYDDAKPKIKSNRLAKLKQKWRNLRDYYTRLNKTAGKDPEKRPKKDYCYANMLTFLSEVMVFSSSSMTSSQYDEIEEPTEIDIEEDEEEDVELEIISRPTRSTKSAAAAAKTRLSASEPAAAEVSRKRPKLAEDDHEPDEGGAGPCDADRLFLLSMEEDLKTMTADEKLDFKIMCLKYFKNVRLGKSEYNGNRETWQE